jgi:Phd_YefM.
MIKNYKECREKAENLDKIFILKNNQPDAVLFSINKYEKFSAFMEYLESLEEEDLTKLIQGIPKEGIIREKDTLEQLIKDAQKNGEILVDEIGRFTQTVHEENKDTQKKWMILKIKLWKATKKWMILKIKLWKATKNYKEYQRNFRKYL